MVTTQTLTLALGLLMMHSLAGYAAAYEPAHRDAEYARVGDHRLLLDLYLPTHHERDCPVVVHGGAWRSGSKKDIPVRRWLEHGFAIASVDYRLSPVARFPAQIRDIKAAVRFLRSRASTYRLASNRLIIAGSSAGGHLAALAGTSAGQKELEGELGDFTSTSSEVQAIVSFFGASNLQTILTQSTPLGLKIRIPALQLLLGGQPDEKPDISRLASPVFHVDAHDPPLWLIHGDQDPQMPIDQSYELRDVYKRHGATVHLEIVPGGKHGGEGFFATEQLDRLALELARAVAY